MSTLVMTPSAPMTQLDKMGLDRTLVISAASLLLIGLVMIASASIDIADSRNGNAFFYVIRHGLFLVLGLIVGFITLNIPMDWWRKTSPILLLCALLLLVIVFVPGVGKKVNGSIRWIGVGSLNLQPSEVAKLFLLAYFAGYLDRRREEVLSSWWGFIKPVVVMALAALMLLAEPDFGATVVIGTAMMGMLFLSGAPLGKYSLLILLGGGLAVLAVTTQDYRVQRLIGFLDPWAEQYGAGYQLTQALIAFGRGEWFGVGLGNSIQKLFYLPEAHTDFVFAILAEEFGVFGSLVVVALFIAIVLRAVRISLAASQRNNLFSALMAFGLAILLGIQSFINMGVNVGLLPTKGLTLPLVSYGGSSLMVSCMCIAILLRIDLENRVNGDVVSSSENGDAR